MAASSPVIAPGNLVARTGDELPPTARLFLSHLADPGAGRAGDRFDLVERG